MVYPNSGNNEKKFSLVLSRQLSINLKNLKNNKNFKDKFNNCAFTFFIGSSLNDFKDAKGSSLTSIKHFFEECLKKVDEESKVEAKDEKPEEEEPKVEEAKDEDLIGIEEEKPLEFSENYLIDEKDNSKKRKKEENDKENENKKRKLEK
jgi:hypothetical protein